MKKLIILLSAVSVAGLLSTAVFAVESVPLRSLRGDVPLTEEVKAPEMKNDQKDHPVEMRNYVQQPPLIPHTIRDYRITAQHNKCMECHSWQRYREFKATKISITHFKDRTHTELANVSPLRYFCTQCHVPQADAAPLVENTFQPIKAISQPVTNP
jgi:nitrate reductase (cytochrome), electron transfer subunit